MHRFFFVSILSLVALGASAMPGGAAAIKKPNVLIILADDMGFSDIGCYGAEIDTPNLDRLAGNGLRLTQMHNTSKCFPSRAVLLTGLYPQQCGMDHGPGKFTSGIFFGEVLRRAGYRTLFVGKHHSTDNPYDWGFDHYRGMRDGAANYFNPGLQRSGEPRPAQKRYGKRVFAFDDTIVQPYTPPSDYYSTDTWTDWALELLEDGRASGQPFCLYVSYQAPHDPLQAHEHDIAKYAGRYEVGYEAIAAARYRRQQEMGLLDQRYPRSQPTHRPWDALSTEEQADQVRRMQVYAAMIDSMDQNIGRLIAKIEAMGELDNTLVLFAADNGASAEVVRIGDGPIGAIDRWASLERDWANVANTPFRLFKNNSYEGGICTPFIAHWPAVIRGGGAIDHTAAHFIDIMPTLIDIAGAEYPATYRGEALPPLSGVSLLPLLRDNSIQRGNPLYFQWNAGGAVITPEWKLVRADKEEWKLYDRQTDLTETRDLSAAAPDIVKELAAQHQAWLDRDGQP